MQTQKTILRRGLMWTGLPTLYIAAIFSLGNYTGKQNQHPVWISYEKMSYVKRVATSRVKELEQKVKYTTNEILSDEVHEAQRNLLGNLEKEIQMQDNHIEKLRQNPENNKLITKNRILNNTVLGSTLGFIPCVFSLVYGSLQLQWWYRRRKNLEAPEP